MRFYSAVGQLLKQDIRHIYQLSLHTMLYGSIKTSAPWIETGVDTDSKSWRVVVRVVLFQWSCINTHLIAAKVNYTHSQLVRCLAQVRHSRMCWNEGQCLFTFTHSCFLQHKSEQYYLAKLRREMTDVASVWGISFVCVSERMDGQKQVNTLPSFQTLRRWN